MSRTHAIVGLGELPSQAAARFGLKAAALDQALRAGLRVPAGVALDPEAARDVVAGDPDALQVLAQALERLAGDRQDAGVRLAVRSSPTCSLPGTLLSELELPSELSTVAAAVDRVLASVRAPAAAAEIARLPAASGAGFALAVLVQAYVEVAQHADFGAVVFTHDPATGDPGLVGELLPGGPASEVVSGRRRPLPLAALRSSDPQAYAQLEQSVRDVTQVFREPSEIELVFAEGRVWILQVRPLVVEAKARVKLALDALAADAPAQGRWLSEVARGLNEGLVESVFPPPERVGPQRILCRGLAASSGVASGVLALDVESAIRQARLGPVVLVRSHAMAEDVPGFHAAAGVVTVHGGLTSHAAVIARGLGVPAVVGCEALILDAARREVSCAAGPHRLREGDSLSVDARRGLVYTGAVAAEPRVTLPELSQLFEVVNKRRRVAIWVRAEPRLALRLRREAHLDGVVCPLAGDEPLPPAEGRECWAEVTPEAAIARCGRLPPGWGLLLRGEANAEVRRALRERAPLLALGEYLPAVDAEPHPTPPDLVVLQTAAAGTPVPARATRLAHLLDGGQAPPAGCQIALYEGEAALPWALLMAVPKPGCAAGRDGN